MGLRKMSGTTASLLDVRIVPRQIGNNDRTFSGAGGTLTLTEEGRKLKTKAVSIPPAIAECIGLTTEEFGTLYTLAYKALKNMEERNGKVIARFEPTEDMENVKAAVAAAL